MQIELNVRTWFEEGDWYYCLSKVERLRHRIGLVNY